MARILVKVRKITISHLLAKHFDVDDAHAFKLEQSIGSRVLNQSTVGPNELNVGDGTFDGVERGRDHPQDCQDKRAGGQVEQHCPVERVIRYDNLYAHIQKEQ